MPILKARSPVRLKTANRTKPGITVQVWDPNRLGVICAAILLTIGCLIAFLSILVQPQERVAFGTPMSIRIESATGSTAEVRLVARHPRLSLITRATRPDSTTYASSAPRELGNTKPSVAPDWQALKNEVIGRLVVPPRPIALLPEQAGSDSVDSYKSVYGDSITKVGDTCYSLPGENMSSPGIHLSWVQRIRAVNCPGSHMTSIGEQLSEWAAKRAKQLLGPSPH